MSSVRTEVLEQRSAVVGSWFRQYGPAIERYATRRVGQERSGGVVSDVFAAVLASRSALPPEVRLSRGSAGRAAGGLIGIRSRRTRG